MPLETGHSAEIIQFPPPYWHRFGGLTASKMRARQKSIDQLAVLLAFARMSLEKSPVSLSDLAQRIALNDRRVNLAVRGLLRGRLIEPADIIPDLKDCAPEPFSRGAGS